MFLPSAHLFFHSIAISGISCSWIEVEIAVLVRLLTVSLHCVCRSIAISRRGLVSINIPAVTWVCIVAARCIASRVYISSVGVSKLEMSRLRGMLRGGAG